MICNISLDERSRKGVFGMSEAAIHFRVDAQTKSEVKSILDQLGLTFTDAMSLYLKQIIFYQGIPFDVRLPNALTAKTIEKVDRGEDLHEAKSVKEMFRELV